MKLRSGTSLDTAPEVVRIPLQLGNGTRNLWSDVASLYADSKFASDPENQRFDPSQVPEKLYEDWVEQIRQTRVSSASSCLDDDYDEKNSKSSNDISNSSRICTRSARLNSTPVSLFSTLKYDLSSDGTSNGKIPKLTIRKRQIQAFHSNTCDVNKTKRLKLIVGKESFHIDLDK